jgi:hypothetical protein
LRFDRARTRRHKAHNRHGGAHQSGQVALLVIVCLTLVQVGGDAKILQPGVLDPLWRWGAVSDEDGHIINSQENQRLLEDMQ